MVAPDWPYYSLEESEGLAEECDHSQVAQWQTKLMYWDTLQLQWVSFFLFSFITPNHCAVSFIHQAMSINNTHKTSLIDTPRFESPTPTPRTILIRLRTVQEDDCAGLDSATQDVGAAIYGPHEDMHMRPINTQLAPGTQPDPPIPSSPPSNPHTNAAFDRTGPLPPPYPAITAPSRISCSARLNLKNRATPTCPYHWLTTTKICPASTSMGPTWTPRLLRRQVSPWHYTLLGNQKYVFP